LVERLSSGNHSVPRIKVGLIFKKILHGHSNSEKNYLKFL